MRYLLALVTCVTILTSAVLPLKFDTAFSSDNSALAAYVPDSGSAISTARSKFERLPSFHIVRLPRGYTHDLFQFLGWLDHTVMAYRSVPLFIVLNVLLI